MNKPNPKSLAYIGSKKSLVELGAPKMKWAFSLFFTFFAVLKSLIFHSKPWFPIRYHIFWNSVCWFIWYQEYVFVQINLYVWQYWVKGINDLDKRYCKCWVRTRLLQRVRLAHFGRRNCCQLLSDITGMPDISFPFCCMILTILFGVFHFSNVW